MNNRVTDILTDLASCLCGQINDPAWGLRGVCFCGVVPGDQAIAAYVDNCDDNCGMAFVRLINAYPAATVGQAYTQPDNCGVGLGLDIEMGILRCFAEGMDPEALPTEEQMLTAASNQYDDLMALRRAVLCCTTMSPKEFILGAYTPAGPLGGVYGGTITLSAVL